MDETLLGRSRGDFRQHLTKVFANISQKVQSMSLWRCQWTHLQWSDWAHWCRLGCDSQEVSLIKNSDSHRNNLNLIPVSQLTSCTANMLVWARLDSTQGHVVFAYWSPSSGKQLNTPHVHWQQISELYKIIHINKMIYDFSPSSNLQGWKWSQHRRARNCSSSKKAAGAWLQKWLSPTDTTLQHVHRLACSEWWRCQNGSRGAAHSEPLVCVYDIMHIKTKWVLCVYQQEERCMKLHEEHVKLMCGHES